jgi:HAD superfamily hydrolase (TIGR01549 family)
MSAVGAAASASEPAGFAANLPAPSADSASRSTDLPVVVDLDGTLVHTDTLHESAVKALRVAPQALLRLPAWLMTGRASLKARLAAVARPEVATLPYNDMLIAHLKAQRAAGRRIVLATAANAAIAEEVAAHLGIFDAVLASSDHANLKGEAKLAAIKSQIGEDFVYIGDSWSDLPIWRAARGGALVGGSQRLREAAARSTRIDTVFPAPGASLAVWLRLIRVHQWLKNLLIFVPLFTAFGLTRAEALLNTGLAFLAFSLAASGTYIVNDLLDLERDRAHPRKRRRPLASGEVSVSAGLLCSAGLLGFAAALCALLPAGFAAVLAAYLVVTTLYSAVLKGYILADVLVLSVLYTMRIIGGSFAAGVVVSSWLLMFSVFVFTSLALVKRCAELVLLRDTGKTAACGRDYGVSDLTVLWPLGSSTATAAVVVFCLFVSAADTQARYQWPGLLWLVCIALIYWLGRLWIKTARGEMHDDPLVYALKDRGSRLSIVAMLALVVAARLIPAPAMSD